MTAWCIASTNQGSSSHASGSFPVLGKRIYRHSCSCNFSGCASCKSLNSGATLPGLTCREGSWLSRKHLRRLPSQSAPAVVLGQCIGLAQCMSKTHLQECLCMTLVRLKTSLPCLPFCYLMTTFAFCTIKEAWPSQCACTAAE